MLVWSGEHAIYRVSFMRVAPYRIDRTLVYAVTAGNPRCARAAFSASSRLPKM